MARLFAGLLALCSLLALSAPAAASRTEAPPGNSGVDEYLEVILGGGGKQSVEGVRLTRRDRLSASARRSLIAQGAAGRAAMDLAELTGAATGAGGKRPGGKRSDTRSGRGSSPFAAAVDTARGSDSGGMGVVLPVILVLAAVAAAVTALLRRRRARQV